MKLIGSILVLVLSFSYLNSSEKVIDSKEPVRSIVIFGATGDLTKRKLIPALVQLEKKGELSEDFQIIGIGRREKNDEQFREEVGTHVPAEDGGYWEKLQKKVTYLKGKFEDDATYEKLAQSILEGNRLYYLSTPPNDFGAIVEKLDQHHLLDHSRVIVEKPFGTDLSSAKELQKKLAHHLKEEQIYRMDHYLGIELIQQILPFRMENEPIDRILNKKYVDHIMITMTEEIGVGTRGNFWEQTGILRDVVQNHVMQMTTLVGMELPKELTPKRIEQEKVNFIESIQSIPLNETAVIRGQYGSGKAPGYREEEGVPPNSNKETFLLAELWVDSKRWKGVPFYIKSGKRLSHKSTQIEVVFKEKLPLRKVVFQIYPTEKISIFAEPDFKENVVYTSPKARGPYEALLFEAMQGDLSHFAGKEELMASWRLWTPLLEYWEKNPPSDFPNYTAGSDGPSRERLQNIDQ